MADGAASDLGATFEALSDARRRDMVTRLASRPMSVSELAAPYGLRLPSAVKHLAVLERSGIVMSEKTGRTRTFRLRPAALDMVAEWVDARRQAMTEAFDRLDLAISDCPEEEDDT